MPTVYDEPFADSSQIPTHLVSKLARQHVTVSLSGDGGDELFAGYNRYSWAHNLKLAIDNIPTPLRSWIARRALAASPRRWDSIYSTIRAFMPAGYKLPQFGDKLHKLAEIIEAPTREEMYWRLISQWKDPADVVIDSHAQPMPVSDRDAWPPVCNFTQQIMLLDTTQYLPDDILAKIDRATMAVGLESRVPLLDHRVFEFAWRLPQNLKIRDGSGKWIVKQVLERYVPRSLFDRPKMGFGIPIGDWLRNDLREWAEDLLSPDTLKRDHYFRPDVVQSLWQDHLSTRRNHQHALWPLLMFQTWLCNSQ